MMNKGFTLVELVVVIAIVGILSGLILFSVTQYISKGKDSNVAGNLAVLIPAGEVFYNAENNANGDGYNGFCDPQKNSVIKNTIAQMPDPAYGAPCLGGSRSSPSSWTATSNPAGVCCFVNQTYYDAWVACSREFLNPARAFCVDSRGMKKEICNSSCLAIQSASPMQCPDDVLSSCH